MLEYKHFLVGDSKVYHSNLIDSNYFSLEDFDKGVKDTEKFKNNVLGSATSLNIPGFSCIQFFLAYRYSIIVSKIIDFANTEVLKLGSSILNVTDPFFAATNWIYYQHSECKDSFWHSHPHMEIPTTEPNTGKVVSKEYSNFFTYVIYLQLPDIQEHGGKLWLSSDLERINLDNKNIPVKEGDVSYTPSQGDMVILPGELPHRPETHTDSKPRIVLAGNIYIEKGKTLM